MTKLFIYVIVICVYILQLSLAAPSTFSDATIQEIRADLEGLPGMHTKAIEDITNTLKKFDDHPMIELLNLALQGDTCTTNNIDLKYIVGIAYRINDEEKLNKKYGNLVRTPNFLANFSEKQLEVIENGLNKHHPTEKVQHVMKILRAYRNAGSHEQQEADTLYFLMSTTKALINGCSTDISTNNRI